jgi:hypothetical protein
MRIPKCVSLYNYQGSANIRLNIILYSLEGLANMKTTTMLVLCRYMDDGKSKYFKMINVGRPENLMRVISFWKVQPHGILQIHLEFHWV